MAEGVGFVSSYDTGGICYKFPHSLPPYRAGGFTKPCPFAYYIISPSIKTTQTTIFELGEQQTYIGSSSPVLWNKATQTGRLVVMGGSWSLRETMKDEPSTIGVTDDCHVAENYNGMRPVRRLSKVYGMFHPARELVEHDKLTVVSVNGEKFVAIEDLRERVCPAEMLVPRIR